MCTVETIRHLTALVAGDTQNPPRNIDGDHPVFSHCRAALGDGFKMRVDDLGDGHVSFHAVRGNPRVLFNVHLDTVPAGPGWSSDPFELQLIDDRAVGRGVCDIKGAAACLLAIAGQQPDNLAVLFTTDEEGTQGRCVRAFCESGALERFSQVVVAEPTGCEAVLGHRGFLAVEGRFHGIPGHSSEPRAFTDNAIHQAARWANAALELAAGSRDESRSETCLNIGAMAGGTANNVIAGEANVQWSARLKPGGSNREFLGLMKSCAPDSARVDWDLLHDGAPLPANGAFDDQARAFAGAHGLTLAGDVDFWTEASIFSEYGRAALVLGPGHIEQAHIVDEWVSVFQLEKAYSVYADIISKDS